LADAYAGMLIFFCVRFSVFKEDLFSGVYVVLMNRITEQYGYKKKALEKNN
jgi:hypothetical protein